MIERVGLSLRTNRGVSRVVLCRATCFLACGAQAWKSEVVVGGEGEGQVGPADGPGVVKDGCWAWTERPGGWTTSYGD